MGKTHPLLLGRVEMVCNICSHALEFWSVRLPLVSGYGRSGLQHLESCTGLWVGKTPSLLMGKREVVCSIWIPALEFGWVRPPLLMVRREVVCNIWSHTLEFGCVRLPPLPMFRREVVCNIWSHALEFAWVRLPPC